MKRYTFRAIFISMLILAGCSTEDNNESDNGITGQWQLVKIEASGFGPVGEVPLPSYQEFVEFKEDNTFRLYHSDGWEARGTYEKKIIDDRNYAEATFENADIMLKRMYDCQSGKILFEYTDTGLLIASSMPCDGPSNTYKKIKEGKLPADH